MNEEMLIVDSFAGGGGASLGIEMALGRSPDIAINHDEDALAMHEVNHPGTLHLSKNIWKVDPLEAVGNRKVGLAWFSPDCKHFSKAKGGKPVKRSIRDLAWVVILWAKRVRPEVIILENVEEFRDWGPVLESGKPCPDRKGETFKRWMGELKRLGYKVEFKELRGYAFGLPHLPAAPTIRKRLFMIARRDGRPIVWPEATHGTPTDPDVIAGRKKLWRTAAEIIDWSLPCPSIFETSAEIKLKHGVRAQRPLADATMRRIARGVIRYVLRAARPFIVPVTHAGDYRVHGVDEPLRTQTTTNRGEHALVTPFVTKFNGNSVGQPLSEPLHAVTANSFIKRPGGSAPIGVVAPHLVSVAHGDSGGRREYPMDEPIGTMTEQGNAHALVSPFMVPRYQERPGQEPRVRSVEEPMATVVPGGNEGIVAEAKMQRVAAFLAQHNTGVVGHDVRKPLSTTTAGGFGGLTQQALVAAHMLNMRGSDRRDGPVDAPAPTATAGGNHASLVSAFLDKYYGSAEEGQPADEPLHSVTTKPRHGLVTVDLDGNTYAIVDIGMRMLTPRERFRAQGFPDSYIIDRRIDGTPISATVQGSCCGNSVCPPLAAALVAANCSHLARYQVAAE